MTRALSAPNLTRPMVRPENELFGWWTLEVITPDGKATVPAFSGWELRAWPVARLGDMTLEARPLRPDLEAADLEAALRRAGYTPLGRWRRSRRAHLP